MKRVLFCGFGTLGKVSLEILKENGYEVVYVMTHKDLSEDSVDLFCKGNGIEYSYKDSRKDLEYFENLFKNLDLDCLISINYRYILDEKIFKIAKKAFNIHGSLLPKYRGRTPHVWAIINGEEYAGITSHLIECGVDSGNIISQKKIKIEDIDTGESILKKYENLYPEILIESLEKLSNGTELIKQNEEEASYFGKRIPEMGYIDFNKNSRDIINFVRAQAKPYPMAYYYLSDGKKIFVNKIEKIDKEIDKKEIGIIKKIDDEFYVKCLDGILKLKEYEIEE